MPKKPEKMRLGITLPPKTAKRLTDYCIKKASRNGKITTHLPSKIGRKAIEEWLDKHENDLTIDFE